MPYITAQEFQNGLTGIQTGNIPAGGLASKILLASSWMDLECHQVLAATTDTEMCLVRVAKDGSFAIYPRCFPIRAVTAVSTGTLPSNMTALTTLANTAVQNRRFTVYQAGFNAVTQVGPIQFGPSWSSEGSLWCQYTYVNGYPVTTLSASCLANASSLTVVNGVGITAGMTLTITDDPNSEMVTVAPTYVFGSTTVPLVTNTVSAHAAGVAVSAMPPGLKQIAIMATAGFITERGTDALVMASLESAPTRQSTQGAGGDSFLQQARQMLNEGGFVAHVSVPGSL